MSEPIRIQVFTNSLGEEELTAIKPIFESKWIGMGRKTDEFENELGKLFRARHVLAVNCCTSALFISMKVMDIKPGDEVIIPSVNFIGTANAVCDVGAIPVFADVDPYTLNILPEEIERLRSKKTRAVLPLHYGGHPCDFDALREAAQGLAIIEDSANSLVSTYKGNNCGTLGDLGCFSFDAMKILCVGDGGALVVNRDDLLERANEYRYFGIRNQKSGIDSFKANNRKWWEINLGCTSGRYISNDIASAIGLEQLKKLESFIARRKYVWEFYQRELRQFDWIRRAPEPLEGCTTSYYLYWITVDPKYRDALAEYLVKRGIYTTFRYYPLHLIDVYGAKEPLPNSELINRSVLNIPLHQNLSDDDLAYIMDTLKSFGETI